MSGGRPKYSKDSAKMAKYLSSVVGSLDKLIKDFTEANSMRPQERRDKLLSLGLFLQSLSKEKANDTHKKRGPAIAAENDPTLAEDDPVVTDLPSLEAILEDIEREHPGALAIMTTNNENLKIALEENTWSTKQCYTPHHVCNGKEYGTQTCKHHQNSMTSCNYCILGEYNGCLMAKHRHEGQVACGRCLRDHNDTCLTYDDFAPLYEYMEANCSIMNLVGNQRWRQLVAWLTDTTAQRVKLESVERRMSEWMNNHTQSFEHQSGRPCRLIVADQKKDARTHVTIWCTETVTHTKHLHQLHVVRTFHLLDAVRRGDQARIDELREDNFELSQRCCPDLSKIPTIKPDAFTLCCEWEHYAFESCKIKTVRKLVCHPGNAVCECNPPCLDNGTDGKYERNIDPVDPKFEYWRPSMTLGKATVAHHMYRGTKGQGLKRVKVEDSIQLDLVKDEDEKNAKKVKLEGSEELAAVDDIEPQHNAPVKRKASVRSAKRDVYIKQEE